MENNTHKEIKVYGTLLNLTINTNPNGTQSDLVDNTHNDYLTVAYQLYDERFSPKKGSGANFAVTAIDRYQDIINKRLTAIYFDDLNTQDGGDDITYIDSKVNISGDTNIEKNLTVEGDATFEGDINITGDINLNIGLNDLNDVTLSTMAIGQVLRYNGSEWVNAKLSLSDILMPAASNGLVLKFNGTEWVASTDETGGGGATKLSELSDVDSSVDSATDGQVLTYDFTAHKWIPTTPTSSTIPSDSYPTLKKYRVKLNLITTCTPHSIYTITDADEDVPKYDGGVTYFYQSENTLSIDNSEIILSKGIESFNNDAHYAKYFTKDSLSLLKSYGKIDHTVDTVNGNQQLARGTFNSYMIAPSVYNSAPTEDVLYINSTYYKSILYVGQGTGYITERQFDRSNVKYYPCIGTPFAFASTGPSRSVAYLYHVIEDGKHVLYAWVQDYQSYWNGALTTPYYKRVYNNDKSTEQSGSSTYTVITSTVTSITQSEFENKVKWDNNQPYISVPVDSLVACITESSSVQMPNYIYGYITTIS